MSLTEGLKAVSEPVNKLLVPIATSVGTTLQDVWDLVFGGFNTYVQKRELPAKNACRTSNLPSKRRLPQFPLSTCRSLPSP